MKFLSFSKVEAAYISEPFSGGVAVQVANTSGKPVRVCIETSIDAEMGWYNSKSAMVDNTTEVFFIKDYAKDQQFRLRSAWPISAVISEMADNGGGGASVAALNEIKARVADLEDGQDPLVLAVNSDGDLEQTGVSSGEFGVDDNGNLTFTDKE